jgi:cell division protein FtsL
MKKLILVFLVAFAGVASADDPAVKQQEQACYDLANHDPAFADSLKKTIDKQLDQQTIDAHNDAFKHIQKNEKHVIYAYAALWVIAAAFLVFLWRRQQGLRSEIAQLRADLAAAGKENA